MASVEREHDFDGQVIRTEWPFARDGGAWMRLGSFLGAPSTTLLETRPFADWTATRSIETALPNREVRYVFDGHFVELNCDENERIRAIFLHRGVHQELAEIPFAWGKREVRAHFGTPSKTGMAFRDRVVGDQGGWDRFSRPTMTIHIQYRYQADEIELITLLRPDSVPQ